MKCSADFATFCLRSLLLAFSVAVVFVDSVDEPRKLPDPASVLDEGDFEDIGFKLAVDNVAVKY